MKYRLYERVFHPDKSFGFGGIFFDGDGRDNDIHHQRVEPAPHMPQGNGIELHWAGHR